MMAGKPENGTNEALAAQGVAGRHRVAERAADEVERRIADGIAPGLHLVATPIGNMADITLRALAVLATADKIYCEDTRQSLKLLQRYGIGKHLDLYHEHNAERERPRILAALERGARVALISDAGTPLISDPGYKLVREAAAAGHRIHVVPGASAVLAGLVGSGLPTDSFTFAGFLPQKGGQRRSRILELGTTPGTLVLFEAPSRLSACLEDLGAVLGDRQAVIGRELTKLNETFHRGSLVQLATWAGSGEVKGEAVILIAPGEAAEVTDSSVEAALTEALTEHSLKDAAAAIAARLGVPRRRVYDLGVKLQRRARGE